MIEIEARDGGSAEVEVIYLLKGSLVMLRVDANQPETSAVFLDPSEARRLAVALVEAATMATSVRTVGTG